MKICDNDSVTVCSRIIIFILRRREIMTVKIITDSTSYLDKEYAKKENITVVPLNYIFDGIDYQEGFKGEFDEFFHKLESTKLFPTTSQPAAGDFYQAFVEGLKDHDEIIAIVLSSKISGTFTSAQMAKDMLEDKKVTIVDSLNAASTLKFLVEDAVAMAKEGKTGEEIAEVLNDKKKHLDVLITTDTLEYLSRGGRLSSVQSSIGNLLNIKPIIRLIDGELKLIEKVRGKNKAIGKIVDLVNPNATRIAVCHILNIEEAEKMKEKLQEKFPNTTVTIEDLGPVVGSHLGPKTLGLCIY